MVRKLGNRSADVLIADDGLTGLLLGAGLAHAGMKVCLLKHDQHPSPETAHAGMLDALPALERIEASRGTNTARQYAAAQQSQLTELLSVMPSYVQEYPAYLYAPTAAHLPALIKRQELLRRMGLPFHIAPDAGGCPFPVELSLTAPGQALVDLPRWRSALRSTILRNGGWIVTDRCNRSDAPLTVFTGDIPPGFSAPLLLERRMQAYCMLTGGPPLHSIQLPVQEGLSLLPCRNGIELLWDAGRCGMPAQPKQLEEFPALISRRLPDWQQGAIRYGCTLVSADGLPLIGALPGTGHLCVLGETGILGAMHAASVLMRRILGQILPEDRLYASDRAAPQNLLRSQQRKLRQIYLSNLLRWRAPTCPHCSCRMRYSTATTWWECPYCGSVFDMFGQIVLSPAVQPTQVSIRQRPDI